MVLRFQGSLNSGGSHTLRDRTRASSQAEGRKAPRGSPSATRGFAAPGPRQVILRVSLLDGLPIICRIMLYSLDLEVKTRDLDPRGDGEGSTGNPLRSRVAMVITVKYQINLVSQKAWQRGKYNHLLNSPF